MDALPQGVSQEIESLIQAALELDRWIRSTIESEEELLVWHVGELLHDLRETEMRMATMVNCREKTIVIDALQEHCTDIVDYIVPHWPLHLKPLRERVAIHCSGSTEKDGIHGSSMVRECLGKNEGSKLLPAGGIDSILSAVGDLRMWLCEEGIPLSVTQVLLDFVADIQSIHKMLRNILPLRALDDLGPALIAFADAVDAMLVRWRVGMTRLRDWLNDHVSGHEQNTVDTGGDDEN